MAELQLILKNPQKMNEMKLVAWKHLLHGYMSFVDNEWQLHEDKVKSSNRASTTHLTTVLQVLKDLLSLAAQLEPECLDSKILRFIQNNLEEFRDLKIIKSQFTKCLNILVSSRSFREYITPVEW